jgi:hypothetical protein
LGQYLDYRWRKNVLTPLTEKSFGKAPSYADIKKDRDARKKDWNENTRDAENRDVSAKVKPIIERNIAAGESAKKDSLYRESKEGRQRS